MFIRYFWSKEVSSRSNSTNIFFSKWVKIHGTVPKITDTVETMKAFLHRTFTYEGHLSLKLYNLFLQ